jgi:hypothetical protein
MSNDIIATEEVISEPTKQLSPDEERELFIRLDNALAVEEEASIKLEQAKAAKQARLAEIAEKCGKGPFQRGTKLFNIYRGIGRGSKDNYSIREHKTPVPKKID